MSCPIPNYIKNANLSQTEQERLSEINIQIFQDAVDSKAFRVYNNKLYTKKYNFNLGTKFVRDINLKYNSKVAKLVKISPNQFVLSVNTLQLSKERQGVLFELEGKNQNENDFKVNYQLKAVTNITNITNNLNKINVWFKQLGNTSKFWDKVQKDLQIPKEQIELVKESYNNVLNKGREFDKNNPPNLIEEALLDFIANYTYSIEINTAKEQMSDIKLQELSRNKEFQFGNFKYFSDNEGYWKFDNTEESLNNRELTRISLSDYTKAYRSSIETSPTQHYSNLTVPGGTNYTENEIATSAITPSIKGHAQFATDKGIGWFRGDDRLAEDTKTDNIDGTITDYTGYNVNKIPSGYTIYNKNRGWLRDATGKPLDFKTEKEASDYLNKLINQGITNNSSIITKNDKIIFGHPTIGKSYLKQKGNNDFITLDDDYADEVNAFIDANRGSETRQEYKGRKPKEYNEFMLNLFDRLKLQAKKEGKRLFVSNTNILKERMSEFDKVITIPKDEFKKRFDARGATYGFEDWKSDIDTTIAKVDKSKVISTTGYLSDLLEGNPKTRRILELQSDLFQKGRDKEYLVNNYGYTPGDRKFYVTYEGKEYKVGTMGGMNKVVIYKDKDAPEVYVNPSQQWLKPEEIPQGLKDKVSKEFEKIKQEVLTQNKSNKENQFLQLLNKDNNWVTFFIKSIIQDSAKQTITEVQESDVEAKVRELEKEGLLEIDCKGKLKAEKGFQTNFTKGGKWKVIKDLKGYPTHKKGGVDLTIGKDGVKIKNSNTEFTAKHGLVIPKN